MRGSAGDFGRQRHLTAESSGERVIPLLTPALRSPRRTSRRDGLRELPNGTPWEETSRYCHLTTERNPTTVSPPHATLTAVSHTEAQLQALIARCEQFHGSEAPEGYPNSLALCVIDSLQSTGVKYPSVEKVVARYRAYRRDRGGDPNTDGTAELLDTFTATSGPEGWAEKIGNGHRTSTRAGAPLKAAAILRVAEVLDAEGITTAAALRGLVDDAAGFAAVRKAWCGVVGQRSGITWRYAGMLAGVPGVKPDRMICRFVGKSLYPERRRYRVGTEFAAEIVTAAAKELDMTATALDHAIWRFERVLRSRK